MKLVFVHGRDQQGKDRADLQRVWEEALDVGLSNAGLTRPDGMTVAFPYYGDELDRLVKALATPLVAGVRTKGDNPDTVEADFRGRLLAELAAAAGISEAAISAQLAGVPTEKGPLNWAWVQAILRALDQTPLGEASIDAFTRDVYVYLTNATVAKAVNKLVAEAVGDEPCVVVAHSLGSVVAYRVLQQLAPAGQVRRFITVGSPLGVTAIREHLRPPALAKPAAVGGWFNALDRRDVVALRALDRSTWDIEPPIENRHEVDNHTKNRHGISGYLDDATVARWIAEGLVG
jgi:hypothetical protein